MSGAGVVRGHASTISRTARPPNTAAHARSNQGRTPGLIRYCGAAVVGDMAVLRQRVKKYADIAPAFEALAKSREQKAVAAEQEGETFEARDNYFIAAQYWVAAQPKIVSARSRAYGCRSNKVFANPRAADDDIGEPPLCTRRERP